MISSVESADLTDRVARFRAAWTTDRPAEIESFLPAVGSKHRRLVLIHLIEADMEARLQAKLPIRLESYLVRFHAELGEDPIPLALLAAEYRLRHRYADKPELAEYRQRFKTRFDAFAEFMSQSPTVSESQVERSLTPQISDLVDKRRASPSTSRDNGDVDSTRVRDSGAMPVPSPYNVLPTDAPYQLIRKIGTGAFGEVYEALAPGGVRVAIKRILRSVDHPDSQSELAALEAIKSLAHPFLLKVNAYWVFHDRLIIVMDLADSSLTARIAHHKQSGLPGVPTEELLPFFEQAAEALDYLHSQNVSHRDLKPENLLLLHGYAKVADFGLCRLHEHNTTAIAQSVGTPSYMAPEVWNHNVSLQSDQYSLAATYVVARLGRPMFATKLIHELALHHLLDTPNLDPLPPAEQQVLLRALAKKPEDRYPSCAAFVQALRTAIEPPPPLLLSAAKRPWLAVVNTVAIALVCALAVALVNRFTRPPSVITPTTEPTAEKLFWLPEGWQAAAGATPVCVGDKDYHNRLTRSVAGESLVAILIVPTRPDDPDPFYMLENKVTNRVFEKVWSDGVSDAASRIHRFSKMNALAPGKWRTEVRDLDGNALGISGKQAGVPVLGVTVPEAMLVAEKLHGLLPTYKQWQKAVGVRGDSTSSPAGLALVVPPELKEPAATAAFKRNELAKRNLALGLKAGPWPVDQPSSDRSWCQIHQLVTNGQEWTDTDDRNQRFDLENVSAGETLATVVGQSPSELYVEQFPFPRRLEPWTKCDDGFAGFRIVLEPK